MSLSNVFYVYVHRRVSDNCVFYVGKGKNRRAYVKQNRTTWWKNIVAKHGLIVEIVLTDMSEENAFELEKELIAFYGSSIINLTAGGEGTTSHNPEYNRRLSESHKARCAAIPNFSQTRRELSLKRWAKENSRDEASDVIASTWRDPVIREKRTNALRAASIELCKNKNYIELRRNTPKIHLSKRIKRSDGVVFDSVNDAARALGAGHGHISQAARGKRQTAYGYTWEYV